MTEDYVSFEVAKLLKEKGFDEDCLKVYINGELKNVVTKEGIKECTHCYNSWLYPGDAAAPTLQMAMKWLREVHKIEIDITSRLSLNADDDHNYSYIIKHQYEKYKYKTYSDGEFLCYEEACEAAIKYCLTNLIANG